MPAETPEIIKVICASSWSIVREGIITVLKKRGDIHFIGEAENGEELLTKVKDLLPDVVITDITLKIKNGYEFVPEISKNYPGIKIIILSMYNDPAVITKMIELGAHSYLISSDSGADEIYTAIVQCHKNTFYFSEVVNNAITKICLQRKTAQKNK